MYKAIMTIFSTFSPHQPLPIINPLVEVDDSQAAMGRFQKEIKKRSSDSRELYNVKWGKLNQFGI